MEVAIKFPPDVRSLPTFRKLKEALGSAPVALFVWYAFWTELFYRAQEGDGTQGRIHRADLPSALAPILDELEGHTADSLTQLLLDANLIKTDGDDYVCLRYMTLNGVAVGNRSAAQMGGDARAFSQRQKKMAGAGALQQTLAIASEKFVDGEGKPLDAEQSQDVTRLIKGCDNALFKNERPPIGFSEGLIQDALAVLRKYTEDEINVLLRTLVKNRAHHALNGMTTEKLLPQLGEVAGRLSGQ